MEKFLLDIILPFHVHDELLAKAMESCLDALPENSRIILVNTIGTTGADYIGDPSVMEIFLEGADYLSALNFGLMCSDAEYVALMNSDDLVDPTRFEKQIEVLKISKADICATNILKFSQESNGSRQNIPPLLGVPPRSFHEGILLLGSFRADASWLFKRDWAIKNHLFSAISDVSDWATAMRVMSKYNSVVISENLYFYRMHARQSSHDKNLHKKKEFYEVWKRLNFQLNLRALSKLEIQVLTSNYDVPRVKEIKNLMKWLIDAENLLKQELPKSEKRSLENLFSRRRVLICYKNRSIHLRLRDIRVLPKILIEVVKYRKYLRGSL